MEHYQVTLHIPKPNRSWLRFSLRSGLVILILGCLVLGYYANQWQQRRKEATVRGKYSVLLRTIHSPSDKVHYGFFRDWGYWTGKSYAGETNLPPGYWVYVAPNWYIWKESTAPSAVDRLDPGPSPQALPAKLPPNRLYSPASGDL